MDFYDAEPGASFSIFEATLSDRPPHNLHRHTFHELYLCTDGRGTQFTPDASFNMRPGDLFIFPAGQDHYANRPREGVSRGLVVFFDEMLLGPDGEAGLPGRVLRAIVREALAGGNRIVLPAQGQAQVRSTLRQMHREWRQRAPGVGLAVRTRMHDLVLAILRGDARLGELQAHAQPRPQRQRLADVYRYLDTHYAQALSVEELADMAALSRSHFHAIFRQETGQTLTQYLRALRLSAATRLLQQTDTSIVDVAYGCGFENLSHFYHMFKSHTGKTPRHVRLGQ